MNLNKFDEWPSLKATKRLIYIGFIVLWVNYPIIIILSLISHYPATFLESQLSFSGAVIKSHFFEMSAEQIVYYVFYQISDDVYDFCHIFMFFGLSLFIARKFGEDSKWRKVGYGMAIVGKERSRRNEQHIVMPTSAIGQVGIACRQSPVFMHQFYSPPFRLQAALPSRQRAIRKRTNSLKARMITSGRAPVGLPATRGRCPQMGTSRIRNPARLARTRNSALKVAPLDSTSFLIRSMTSRRISLKAQSMSRAV